MITFEHVSKRYPGTSNALQDVNFHLDAGEMVFLTELFDCRYGLFLGFMVPTVGLGEQEYLEL